MLIRAILSGLILTTTSVVVSAQSQDGEGQSSAAAPVSGIIQRSPTRPRIGQRYRRVSHYYRVPIPVKTDDDTTKESNWKLVDMKCVPDDDDGTIDSVPASPPLVVDDPETPGCNNWEINVVFDGDFSQGTRSLEIPLFDINYGIGQNLQLKYEVPFMSQSGGDVSGKAWGNSEIGLKWMFFQGGSTNIAVYPQAEFEKDQAEKGTVFKFPILLSRQVGTFRGSDVFFTGNVGFTKSTNPDVSSTTTAAAGLGIPVHQLFGLSGEVEGERANSVNKETGRKDATLTVRIAVTRPITKNIMAFASYGHSVYTSDGIPHKSILIGISGISRK